MDYIACYFYVNEILEATSILTLDRMQQTNAVRRLNEAIKRASTRNGFQLELACQQLEQLELDVSGQYQQAVRSLEHLETQLVSAKDKQQQLQIEHQKAIQLGARLMDELSEHVQELNKSARCRIEPAVVEELRRARFLLSLYNEFVIVNIVGGVALQFEFCNNTKTTFCPEGYSDHEIVEITEKDKSYRKGADANLNTKQTQQKQNTQDEEVINGIGDIKMQYLQYDTSKVQLLTSDVSIINEIQELANMNQFNDDLSNNQQSIQMTDKQDKQEAKKKQAPLWRITAGPLEDSPLVPPAVKYALNNPIRRPQMLLFLQMLQTYFQTLTAPTVTALRLLPDQIPSFSLLKIRNIYAQVSTLAQFDSSRLIAIHNKTIKFIQDLIAEISDISTAFDTPSPIIIYQKYSTFSNIYKNLIQTIEAQCMKDSIKIDALNSSSISQILYNDLFTQKIKTVRRMGELNTLFRLLNIQNPNFFQAKLTFIGIKQLNTELYGFSRTIFAIISINVMNLYDNQLIEACTQDFLNIQAFSKINDDLQSFINIRTYISKIRSLIMSSKVLIKMLLPEQDVDETFLSTVQKMFRALYEKVENNVIEKYLQERDKNMLAKLLTSIPVLSKLLIQLLQQILQPEDYQDTSTELLNLFETLQQRLTTSQYGYPLGGSLNILRQDMQSRASGDREAYKRGIVQPLIYNIYLQRIAKGLQKELDQNILPEVAVLDVNTDMFYALGDITTQHDDLTYQHIYDLSEQEINKIRDFNFHKHFEEFILNEVKHNETKIVNIKSMIEQRKLFQNLYSISQNIDQISQIFDSIADIYSEEIQEFTDENPEQQINNKTKNSVFSKLLKRNNAKKDSQVISFQLGDEELQLQLQSVVKQAIQQSNKQIIDSKFVGFFQQLIDVLKKQYQTIQNDMKTLATFINAQPKYPLRYFQYNQKQIVPNYVVRGLIPPVPVSLLIDQNIQKFIENVAIFDLQKYQAQYVQAVQEGTQFPNEIIQAALNQSAYQITLAPVPSIIHDFSIQTNQLAQLSWVQRTQMLHQLIKSEIKSRLLNQYRLVQQTYEQISPLSEISLQLFKFNDNDLNMTLQESLNEESSLSQQQLTNILLLDPDPLLQRTQYIIGDQLQICNKQEIDGISQSLYRTIKVHIDSIIKRLDISQNHIALFLQKVKGPFISDLTLPLCCGLDKPLQEYDQQIQQQLKQRLNAFAKQKRIQRGADLMKNLRLQEDGLPIGFTNQQQAFQHKILVFDGHTHKQMMYESHVMKVGKQQQNCPIPYVLSLDILLTQQKNIITYCSSIKQVIISLEQRVSQEVYGQIKQLFSNLLQYIEECMQQIHNNIVNVQISAFKFLFSTQQLENLDVNRKQKNFFKLEHLQCTDAVDLIPDVTASMKFVIESLSNFKNVCKQLLVPDAFKRVYQKVLASLPTIYLAHISRLDVIEGSPEHCCIIADIVRLQETFQMTIETDFGQLTPKLKKCQNELLLLKESFTLVKDLQQRDVDEDFFQLCKQSRQRILESSQ